MTPNKPGIITATRKVGWDAAHRVLRHESKCGTLHGHRYTAEITCQAPQLDDVGRVIDFGVMKEVIGTWIDENLDHTTICNDEDDNLIAWCEAEARQKGKKAPYIVPYEPTAENIARLIHEVGTGLLKERGSLVQIVNIRIWETPNCFADYTTGPL